MDKLLTKEASPWWARSRDALFALAFIALLAAVLGILPSPLGSTVSRIEKQHSGMLEQLKVSCYHETRWIKDEAERDRARLECLNTELYLPKK